MYKKSSKRGKLIGFIIDCKLIRICFVGKEITSFMSHVWISDFVFAKNLKIWCSSCGITENEAAWYTGFDGGKYCMSHDSDDLLLELPKIFIAKERAYQRVAASQGICHWRSA